MAKIKAILADIDGTLIEGGNIKRADLALKKATREVRDAGDLF